MAAGSPPTDPGPLRCGSTIALTADNVFVGIVSVSTVNNKNLSSEGWYATVPAIILSSYGLSSLI